MKKTIVTIALGFNVVLAATPVLAVDPTDEPIDCFYEENQSHELCRTVESAQPAPTQYAESEYVALQSMIDEPVDCFYDASRWDAACAVVP